MAEFMNRLDLSKPAYGAVYHEKIVLTSNNPVEIKIPNQRIDSIGLSLNGDGAIYFTLDPHDEIDNGSPEWIEWDGAPEVNKSVTGFKITWNSGTVTARVTVKTMRV